MSGPFTGGDAGMTLRLGPEERQVLQSVPALLAAGGDAGGRLDYRVHPDDPAAEERYRSLVNGDLDQLRASDGEAFTRVASGTPASAADVESFMRVVGEARLVLAARLGIEEDGWEADIDESNPEMALLSWLGYLQDAAVTALERLL